MDKGGQCGQPEKSLKISKTQNIINMPSTTKKNETKKIETKKIETKKIETNKKAEAAPKTGQTAEKKKGNPHIQKKPRPRVYPNRILKKRFSKNKQPRPTKKYVRNMKLAA
jgi:hypothetical protein